MNHHWIDKGKNIHTCFYCGISRIKQFRLIPFRQYYFTYVDLNDASKKFDTEKVPECVRINKKQLTLNL